MIVSFKKLSCSKIYSCSFGWVLRLLIISTSLAPPAGRKMRCATFS